MSRFGARANDPQLDLPVGAPPVRASRSTSTVWSCDKCGVRYAFFDPGPHSPTHHGKPAGGTEWPCGGEWRK